MAKTRMVKRTKGSQELHDQLMADVIVALNATGKCRCWENKTGAAYREGKLIHYGLLGSADIMGLMKNGRFMGIEIKSGCATQSEQQMRFEKMIHTFNGHYLVARDVTTAVEWLLKRCEL